MPNYESNNTEQVIGLLELQAAEQRASLDAIERNAQYALAASSFILVSALALNVFRASEIARLSSSASVLALLFAILAHIPTVVATFPMKPVWPEAERWRRMFVSDFNDALIASYISIIAANDDVTARKSRLTSAALLFLALAAVALLGAFGGYQF